MPTLSQVRVPSKTASAVSVGPATFTVAGVPWTAAALLVLTAAISLFLSSYKLLRLDEFFVLWTDSLPSMGQVVHVQRSSPISLDPVVYHVLAHAAVRLFGAGAFGIRLPSLLGYLAMQLCLFFFVRRVATERAAVFALAVPVLPAAFWYSAEGRPYGLMLGLCGIVMVSWQAATRCETKRTVSLIILALALALILNTHYFGVLLLVPLFAAELFRTIQRRRLDFPILASLGAGSAGIVFAVPFMKAAGEFREHYNNLVPVRPRLIASAYIPMFTNHIHTHRNRAIFLALLAVVALIVLWSCIRQVRVGLVPDAEAVFLIVLSGLPLFGYLLARSVTHAFEVRYVLCAIIGITALLAIGLRPFFRRDRIGDFTQVILFVAVALAGATHILATRKSASATLSVMTVTPEIKSALMASTSKRLYFQSVGAFAQASYYEPDMEIRSRVALVYSMNQELHWNNRDTVSLTALHMRRFTHLNVEPYESVTIRSGDHIFVDDRDPGWNWIDRAFATSYANVSAVGSGLGGDVVSVRFLP